MTRELSCFISPHGFGHATRTIGVLEAVHERVPELQVRIFSTVPQSLFKTCPFPLSYHRTPTDIGLIQHDAFTVDHQQTLRKLQEFLPLPRDLVDSCAALCSGSRLLLCDISPLGIAVGKVAGIPSLLLENFTWDWIYQSLSAIDPAFSSFAAYYAACYEQADIWVQTEPLCHPLPEKLCCPPIARCHHLNRAAVREALGVADETVVLISMGGFPAELPFLAALQTFKDSLFLVAGAPGDAWLAPNVRMVAATTHHHHPDLINAADLLICKSGYSTIAECAQTKTPLLCVSRPDFAESAVLADYVTNRLGGSIMTPDDFMSGNWLTDLPRLLAAPRRNRRQTGNRLIADVITAQIGR